MVTSFSFDQQVGGGSRSVRVLVLVGAGKVVD